MRSNKHFNQLDGLRGLAAITVVVEHLSNANMPLAHGYLVGGQSRIAVWVFFALSSFLLTTQAIEVDHSARIEWSLKYLLRRFFRIYPLFVACLTADLVLGRLPWHTAFEYLTLTTSPSLNYIYWSVPPEFLFYFLVPAIGFLAAINVRITTVILLLVIVASMASGLHYNFFTFLSTFLFGSIAAIIYVNWPAKAVRFSLWWPAAPIVALLCSFPLIEITGLGISPIQWNGMHGALWSIVILACASNSPKLRWLASRPLRYLGSLSFSIYLIHPWIVAIGAHLGLKDHWWSGAVLMIAVVAFASLSFRIIEDPARRLGLQIERSIFRTSGRNIAHPSTIPNAAE